MFLLVLLSFHILFELQIEVPCRCQASVVPHLPILEKKGVYLPKICLKRAGSLDQS